MRSMMVYCVAWCEPAESVTLHPITTSSIFTRSIKPTGKSRNVSCPHEEGAMMTVKNEQVLTQKSLAVLSPDVLRSVFAREEWGGPTLGLALGHLQANLVILPREFAWEFMLFCHRNPKPCPLIEVTEPGSPFVREIAADADLRTTLPRYRVFKEGQLDSEPFNVKDVWAGDSVGFLLGCSLTFESSLLDAGIPIRHLEENTSAPVYVTSRPCAPAGRFSGPLVVSMRPIPADLVSKAVQITARYPWGHGSPMHIGDPEALGIEDLSKVDFGDPPIMKEGDVPVFWGCGITPQLAVENAKPPYMITHYPQHMFIADRRSEMDAAN
ncbi:MAG: hypothetical protein JW395_1327 [Nitrospira sp.]|nr:hypothetical protein [Nitrospira sp.]